MKTSFCLFIAMLYFYVSGFSQPLVNYTYWDTVRYQDNSYIASQTTMSDINKEGLIVGFYKDAAGANVGFVYNYKSKKFHTYQYSGYTHTEITGINDNNIIIGRAYSNPTTAIAIKGEIINDSIQNVTQANWHLSATTNKWPTKINNNNVGAGSIYTGTTRWFNYESILPPITVSATKRYEAGTTQYNSYGKGINDYNTACGYYLNGSQYIPCIYDETNNQFFIYNHKVSSVAQPRTILNDINNSYYIAVSYRDSNNIMQGTIARNSPIMSITYETDENFIFNKWDSYYGSSIEGISEKNDIAGYYVNASGEQLGFYAISDSSQYVLEQLNVSNDVFKVGNWNLFHEYENGYYDYTVGDVWLGQVNDFNQSVQQATIVSPFNHPGYYNGLQTPSWKAWVMAYTQDSCYIQTPQGLKPKSSSLAKWVMTGSPNFQGVCYGMSAFYLQHLKDRFMIDSRFSLGVWTTSYIQDYDTLATGVNYKLTDILHALHLFQGSKHLASHTSEKDYIFYNNPSNNWTDMEKEFKSFASGFQSIDSAHIMLIRYKDDSKHAVVPVGVSRQFRISNGASDTLHIMDPNFPNTFPIIYRDHISQNVIQRSYMPWNNMYRNDTLKYFIAANNVNELAISNPVYQSFKLAPSPENKSVAGENVIYTKKLCDFKTEAVGNSSLYFERIGNTENNSFTSVNTIQDFNADGLTDGLVFPGSVDVKTTISSNCDSLISYMYSYPKGEMLYARKSNPSLTDIVYNKDNIIRFENPDNLDKYPKLTAIYGPNIEESMVVIDSFKLAYQDTMRYEAIDQYNFKLSNGKPIGNVYNLYVRYLSQGNYFIWNTQTIPIQPKTDHIIKLQPSVSGQEVIILIDSLQDGSIDDSIKVINGGLSLQNIEKSNHIKVYPNPTQQYLHWQADFSIKPKITIYNFFGSKMIELSQKSVNTSTNKIDVSALSTGLYFIQFEDYDKGIKEIKRFSKIN
ncbi:MAG: T9SS type A sorting domain-containing protein [Chitinophagaceae bacterium]